MHAEALGGGVAEFDAAVRAGVCPYLNQLGDAALGAMREVYEQLDAGDYSALGDLAEQLATAAEQKAATEQSAPQPQAEKSAVKSEEMGQQRAEPAGETKTLFREPPTPAVTPAAKHPAQPAERAQAITSETILRHEQQQPTSPRAEAITVAEALPVVPPLEVLLHHDAGVAGDAHMAKLSFEPSPASTTRLEAAPPHVVPLPELPTAAPPSAPDLRLIHEVLTQSSDPGAEILSIEADTPSTEYEFAQTPHAADAATQADPLFLDALPSGEEITADAAAGPALHAETMEEFAPHTETPAIYDNFAKALEAVIADTEAARGVSPEAETAEELQPTAAVELSAEPIPLAGTELAPASPRPASAIAEIVVERMATLEAGERETVVPLLQKIAETVQAIDTPLAAEAEPVAIEEAQAKLELLVTNLFERLGIARNPAIARQFVAVLLQADLQSLAPETYADIDPERQGTHEIKLHFSYRLQGFPAFRAIGQLLGGLVLLYATREDSQERTLVPA